MNADPAKVVHGIAIVLVVIGWMGIFEPRFSFLMLFILGCVVLFGQWYGWL